MRLQTVFTAVVLLSLSTFWFLLLTLLLDTKDIQEERHQHTHTAGLHVLVGRFQPPSVPVPRDNGGCTKSPAFNTGNGGVILFVHIPKTGGTTIRDNFSNTTRFPHVEYVAVYSLKQFRAARQLMEQRFSAHSNTNANTNTNTNQKILFVELHGHNTPTLLELEPLVRNWKQQVQQQQQHPKNNNNNNNNKDKAPFFFVFTLLRDPIELAVSFFNFFHVFGDKRFGPQLTASVTNLRNTLQWNPQCLYLVKGERPYFRPDMSYNVTPRDCQQVALLLFDNNKIDNNHNNNDNNHDNNIDNNNNNDNNNRTAIMDWVGDTSRLSMDTLPLLVDIVTAPNKNNHHNNKGRDSVAELQLISSNVAATRRQRYRPLSKSELDASTMQAIQRMTVLDQQLYRQAVASSAARQSLVKDKQP